MADVWSQPQIQLQPAPASLRPVYPDDSYTNLCSLYIPLEKRNCLNSPIYLIDGTNGSVTYRGGDYSSGKFTEHRIDFSRDTFTVDGGPPRKINDPQNRSFLMSLIETKLPDEFRCQGGYHKITALKSSGKRIKTEDVPYIDSDESSSGDSDGDYSDSDEE